MHSDAGNLANSQGLYPLGIFIVAAYWAECVLFRRQSGTLTPKRATAVLALCIGASLITPYGIRGIALPFRLLSAIVPAAHNLYSVNISENIPLLSLAGWEKRYLYQTLAAAILCCTLFAALPKRARPAHYILCAGFLFLAFCAVRNVLLFFEIVVPIAGCGLAQLDFPALRIGSVRKRAVISMCILLAFFAWPVQQHCSAMSVFPRARALSPFRFPEKIADYLQTHPHEGSMFNDIRSGGYLLWRLYPPTRVFADGRIVARPDRFFAEYLAICEDPELFPLAANKFHITYAILPSGIFPLYRPLISWLYHSPDWRLEFTDGSFFLFAKNEASSAPALRLENPKTVAATRDSISAQWRNAPYVRNEALQYFANALHDLGIEDSSGEAANKKARFEDTGPGY